jgi:hypothetical protein
MGKARRVRAQRRAARQEHPRLSWDIRTVDDMEAAPEVFQPEMPCRVCYIGDPVLGGGQPCSGIGPDGSLVPDDSGTVEPLPAVLFEPLYTAVMTNTVTGFKEEAKTEAVIARGFHRLGPDRVWVIKPAEGWEVRRLPGELVLRDSTGEIWARSELTPDPAWVSAAASYKQVAVFYGPRLGVRPVPGTDPTAYTIAVRAAEFRQARRLGLVAAATVAWHGAAGSETMDWVTFLPGSFGLPLPGIFAPAVNFSRLGGPAVFGLARLSDHGIAVPAEPSRTLVARVSKTDVDIIDPAETRPHDLIGGVRYSEGLGPWRQAALSAGVVVLLTGSSLPGLPGTDPGRIDTAFAGLWGAILPVRAG